MGQSTNKELEASITITICADRTLSSPTVTFKDNACQVKWKQDNSLHVA
jgi:hypothetical protein